MSRDLAELHPEVRWRAEKLIQAASAVPIPILIYFTLRTFQEQETLYELGRSKPGKVVTNAKPGQSYHNYGLAFDFGPVDAQGAIKWDDLEGFTKVGELGEDLGLQWGGRWPKLKDYPHVQMSFGFSIDKLRCFWEAGELPVVWAAVDQKILQEARV